MELTEKEKEGFVDWKDMKAEEHYGMYVALKREINLLKCDLEIEKEKIEKIQRGLKNGNEGKQ